MSEKMIRVKSCYECPYRAKIEPYNEKYCSHDKGLFDLTDDMFTSIHPDCPLEDASRWRKYPEEKPEKDGLYIVLYNDNNYALFNWFARTKNWEEFHNAGADFDIVVTHWMPIPEIGE